MKKTMLISAIIASATAYSATDGYIDSNANFEAKKIIGGGQLIIL